MIRPVIRNVIRTTVKAAGDLFGPEISTDVGFDNSGEWNLNNSTVESSLLTLFPEAGVLFSSAQSSSPSSLFDEGDLYSVEYTVVSSDATVFLFLSASGFTNTTLLPAVVGFNKIVVECTIEDGSIRLATDAASDGTVVLSSLSVRKITQGRGVIQ